MKDNLFLLPTWFNQHLDSNALSLFCIAMIFSLGSASAVMASEGDYRVTTPPAELKLLPFYKKYVSASGYPIVSSDKVNDYALKEAAYLIDMLLAERPDVRRAMIASGSRMIVMAQRACGRGNTHPQTTPSTLPREFNRGSTTTDDRITITIMSTRGKSCKNTTRVWRRSVKKFSARRNLSTPNRQLAWVVI